MALHRHIEDLRRSLGLFQSWSRVCFEVRLQLAINEVGYLSTRGIVGERHNTCRDRNGARVARLGRLCNEVASGWGSREMHLQRSLEDIQLLAKVASPLMFARSTL